MGLPTVSSMWIGSKLSFLERLCLKSFVDAGHHTKLYIYEDVEGIPEGVEICSADDIMPSSSFIYNKSTGKPGPHADKFRYRLLKLTDEIWVDTDAYCLKPFPNHEYLFAPHYKSLVANGVLRLPKNSSTLNGLIDFTSSEFPQIPDDFPNLGNKFREIYSAKYKAGSSMHVSEMPWEIRGPFTITYFLSKHNELSHAAQRTDLYPLGGGEIFKTLQKSQRTNIQIPDNAISIHFYGSKIYSLLRNRANNVPQPNSLLGKLCIKHGIDPNDAPIPA